MLPFRCITMITPRQISKSVRYRCVTLNAKKNVFDKIYVKIIYLGRRGAVGTCIKQECLTGHLPCPRPGGRISFSSPPGVLHPVMCHETDWVKRFLHFHLLRIVLLGEPTGNAVLPALQGLGVEAPWLLMSGSGRRCVSHTERSCSLLDYIHLRQYFGLHLPDFFLSYFLDCFINCQKKRCMKV